MLLRHHPLMRYKDLCNWPPGWLWIDGVENKHPRGEIGILKAAELSNVLPATRCFLEIDYEGSTYVGCLLFDDEIICAQITKILQGYLNRPIAEIGSIDLSHLL
jgi:hypothetical protein